jgi:hypothetical protein
MFLWILIAIIAYVCLPSFDPPKVMRDIKERVSVHLAIQQYTKDHSGHSLSISHQRYFVNHILKLIQRILI